MDTYCVIVMIMTLLPAARALLIPALPASAKRLIMVSVYNPMISGLISYTSDRVRCIPEVIIIAINRASWGEDQPLAGKRDSDNATLAHSFHVKCSDVMFVAGMGYVSP